MLGIQANRYRTRRSNRHDGAPLLIVLPFRGMVAADDLPPVHAAFEPVCVTEATHMDLASGRFGFDQIGNGESIGGCDIAVDDDFLAGANMGGVDEAAAFSQPIADRVAALHVEQARIACVPRVIGKASANQVWIAAVDGEKIAVDHLLHSLPLVGGRREQLISP